MVLHSQCNYMTLNNGKCFDFCIIKPPFWQALAMLLVSTNYGCLKVDVSVTCNVKFMGNFGADFCLGLPPNDQTSGAV